LSGRRGGRGRGRRFALRVRHRRQSGDERGEGDAETRHDEVRHAPHLTTGGPGGLATAGRQHVKCPAEDTERMAYIITEPCIGTKDSACVDVCPVDCIHPRKDEPAFESVKMLNIHPDECIDCGVCVPACPVEAIFALDEVPDKWKDYIQQNADYFKK
jgi:ferredoxin